MTSELKDEKKEKISLNHISNYLNSISQPRLAYLGLLVTLNVAIYSVFYYLDEAAVWEITGTKLCLILLLIFLNWIFTVILLREHNIKKLTDRWFHNYLTRNKFRTFIDYKTYLDDNDKMRGDTWEMTKQVLAFFNAVPLAAIAYYFFFCYTDILETDSMSLGIFLIMIGVFHLIYSGYFYYREN